MQKSFYWVSEVSHEWSKSNHANTLKTFAQASEKWRHARKCHWSSTKIAACEQKTTSEIANFCSDTVFSLYFNFRAKKFHDAKPLAFSLHFLFRRDQNHYSNLTSKIMKMCEQILKKERRPNTIQILWIVKNEEKANNSPSYRCAAIKKHFQNLFSRISFPDSNTLQQNYRSKKTLHQYSCSSRKKTAPQNNLNCKKKPRAG